MDYTDLNFDGFLYRTILSSNRQSPIEVRNNIPFTSLSAASIGSPLSASTDITFSSTDNDTAAWTAGTVYFADGSNSGQIAAGNTGNIGATTYIYFDKNKPGSLQTTTDHSEAVGPTKFLVATVEIGATGKDCKITPTIAAGLIVSGITADQIAANTVTVGNLDSDTRNQVQLNLPSDEDLISCWNFNEGAGTNIYDSSGNDNTGTLGNTPTWIQGVSGKCLDFNPANNEYAQLFTPSDAGTELGTEQSGKFSWSLWFRSETTSGDDQARIVSRDCSDYWCLMLDQTVVSGSQELSLYLNDGTNLLKSSINTNQWYHIIFVLNYDSGEAKLYIDGSLEDSNSNLGVSDGTSRGVCVAVNEENGPHVGSNEFDGKVDEIRVYNIALTAKEVYALYKLPAGSHSLDISATQKMTDWQHSSDVTMIDGGDIYTESVTVGKLDSDTQNQVQLNLPSDVNMVACWSFDSQNSSVAPDLSGKGNDGSLIGIAAANYGIGISQQRIDFNGTDEGMGVTDTSDINLMTVINRSYSFWIKADDTSTQQLVYKEGGRTNCLAIYIESNNVYFTYADSGVLIGYCSATFSDTNWHHIACTFDSSSGVEALYIDGVSQDTDNKSQSVGQHPGNISMAYNDGDYFDKDGNVIGTSDYYNGKIDEFRIYNQTLTAKEVYALYKIPSGNSAKTSRFEAWSHSSDVTKIDGGDIYTGTVTAGKITITDLADLSTSTGTVNVGNANVKIDGDNTRIIINDGTNDRILIGYDLGGF